MLRLILVMFSVFACCLLWNSALQAAPIPVPTRLAIGDGSGWSFAGGKWVENQPGDKPVNVREIHSSAFFEEGVIMPPDKRDLHTRAFFTAKGYKDFTAEFEYNANYRENGGGIAGMILRSTDSNHFYFVYFPWIGQQWRAGHFWAAIAKVEGDGYIRNIKMAYVPGVPSEVDRWYKVQIEAKGPQISVKVNGRKALSVVDSTYKSGCVGLAGYGMYYFRNVIITGASVKPPVWSAKATIPTHSFNVGLNSSPSPSGCMAPNGDVLLFGASLASGNAAIARSKDQGRTWSLEELPDKMHNEVIYRTRDGRLMFHRYHHSPGVYMSESKDNGKTWSDTFSAKMPEDWPRDSGNMVAYGPLIETEDGTQLRFIMGSAMEKGAKYDDIHTWGAVHAKAYAIRSTDGGKSWSLPIEIDRPIEWTYPAGAKRGHVPGSLDMTEVTGVAMGNRVTVVVRPTYESTMWQCWSDDAGATWDAAAHTSFAGYAQSTIRTSSGYIVVAHRYPQYSVNVSRDNGLNWDEGALIDCPSWAMGCMVEVAPDVVLCTYMNAASGDIGLFTKQPLLAQLFRVTKDRIVPLDPKGKW
ncbi:MAG: sialidase family protein [Dehalococcoidia bacterium]|nr:sialidase family protein [Dehalococcoidia bacterium]